MDIGTERMSDDSYELRKLRDIIVGLRMQIELLESDLVFVKGDLANLEVVRHNLKENIKILKRNDVVSMVSEYRRSKEGLIEIDMKIHRWKAKEDLIQCKIKLRNKDCDETLDSFTKLKKKIDENVVVLKFDKNKRRAK